MSKSVQILRASNDIDDNELKQITAVAELYRLKVKVTKVASVSELKSALNCPEPVDYLYLATHACTQWFGSDDGRLHMRWEELALAICESGCLAYDAAILLGCCRGGHHRVATTLLAYCKQISYVFGPRWTVTPDELTLGLHCVLYNTEVRREQPNIAVERATQATGYDFYSYDRAEVEDEWERYGFPYILQKAPGNVKWLPTTLIALQIRNYRDSGEESSLGEDERKHLQALEAEYDKRMS